METDLFSLSAQENVSRGWRTARYTEWGRMPEDGVKRLFLPPLGSFCIVFQSVIATNSNELLFVVTTSFRNCSLKGVTSFRKG